MKSFIRFFLLIFFVLIVLLGWFLLSSATNFSEKNKSVLITKSDIDNQDIAELFSAQRIVKHPSVLQIILHFYLEEAQIKPGKYEFKKGQNILSIIRQLKKGRTAEVKLVINKIRIKEDLAKIISKNFAIDSISVMQYIGSNDSLQKWKVDTNTLFTMIIPDTYNFYWDASLDKIFQKLSDASHAFWLKNNREAKIEATNLNKNEVYILASIVDEETNYDSDKYKIASVYLNRLKKNMPLQACPTIKFAMKDFTLTRIYEKYLSNPSLYNTYKHKGLPPGPICTPSPKTIDIVLNAPKTDYLFFVAKSDFSGYHHFSSNFAEHNTYAKEYQKALDIYMAQKQSEKH